MTPSRPDSTILRPTAAVRRLLLLVVAAAVAVPAAWGQDRAPKALAVDAPASGPVYIVPMHGTIDNALARYVARAVDEAEAVDAALVLFHVDTFGGLVAAADEIRKTILDAEIPTLAFVDKNAASAGALISYAADRIVMVPGGSIGAATVVQGGTGEAAPDKYQSYMRGLMRATAEANGRDPRIAEAMVDETLVVEGVSEAGKVLTLSADEALALGVADAVLPDEDAVIAASGLADREVVSHRASRTEQVLRFFGSPVIQSILMLMMLGGLYFELQTPGVGFAGAASLVGAAMFFAPHYLLGLVESWEIVLFGIGVLLLFVELLVVPGFGVPGVLGVLLVVGSLLAALVGNVGLRFPGGEELASAVMTMAVTMVLLVVLAFSLSRYLPRSARFNRLVLASELGAATGYTAAETEDSLVGQTGRALTPLRPAGMAHLAGARVDVVTAGEYIAAGTPVRVVRVRGSRVEVCPVVQLAEGETSAA